MAGRMARTVVVRTSLLASKRVRYALNSLRYKVRRTIETLEKLQQDIESFWGWVVQRGEPHTKSAVVVPEVASLHYAKVGGWP
jgi:hypothetical protein